MQRKHSQEHLLENGLKVGDRVRLIAESLAWKAEMTLQGQVGDRILRTERKYLEPAVGNKRHAQIVEHHYPPDLIGMQLREIHRDVGASGMSYHRELVVIRVRLDLLHFLDSEFDVGNTAQVLRLTADIEFADFRHHRWIGRQIVLYADRHEAARGKHVRQEAVLGEFDRVAVIEHRHRQLDQACISLNFFVPSDDDFYGDRTVVAARIIESNCLIPDG